MRLNLNSLKDKGLWEKADFQLPKFNIEEIRKNTKENPTWIHFGPGNIFRSLLANAQQNLLNKEISDKGIIAVGGSSIESVYRDHDNLTVLVKLKVDGSIEKTVIGSISESLILDQKKDGNWKRLEEVFKSPGLQMVSFTITEKGYNLKDDRGEYLKEVEEDFENGPKNSKSYMGQIASLLYDRYLNGNNPLALVSMDNMSGNGMKLYESINEFAKKWVEKDLIEEDFLHYINNPKLVSFPWTMIDKITPRPDESVKQMLRETGFKDVEDIITPRGSYSSPFVNAEEKEYLVIEDLFPNGRPKLEDSGVIFTDRETVKKVERMKVSTCLNPLHTTLAIYGCLLGYNLISEEMKDGELKTLIEKIGYEEGFPVVVDPGIIDPEEFIREVIQIRFPNPFMPDTPQRIAMDTSQKLKVRFGETIKAYEKSDNLETENLKYIPLVLAGWIRYLVGVDDNGEEMELSPDPLLESLKSQIHNIKLGDRGPFEELKQILSNDDIFGVDLYKVQLGKKVESYFEELISGKGAVRKTLKKHLS